MLRSKKTLAAATVVLVALLVVLSLGSRQVAARASRALEARLELDADVGGASLGLGSVSLSDLVLRSDNDAIEFRIQSVRVGASPWSIALRGLRAVEDAELSGVEVLIDLARPGFAESLDELREALQPTSRSTSSARPAKKRRGRHVHAEDVRLRIRDTHGPLADFTLDEVTKRPNGFDLAVRTAFVGNARADHADVNGASVSLVRENGKWKLRLLELKASSVRWLGSTEEEEPLVRRIKNARRLFRRSGGSEPAASARRDSDIGSERAWVRRLAEGAEVRAGPIHIESRSEDGRVDEIDGLRFEVLEDGNGWFRLRGEGQATGASNIWWNLRAHPKDLRGEGTVRFDGVSLALLAPFVPEIPFHEAERSEVRGELTLTTDAPGPIAFRGDLVLDDVAFFSERIAAEPIVDVDLKLIGEGTWDPQSRTLVANSIRAQLGNAEVQLSGTVERSRGEYRYDLTAVVPQAACNDVFGAIPPGLLGRFRRFSWSGNWGATARLVLDSRDLDAAELSVRALNGCKFTSVPWIARTKRFRGRFTHRVEEPDEKIFRMVTGPGTKNWVPLDEISPFVQEAVVTHEDGGFYNHSGFAVYAIRDALVRNLREGRYAVGASTITMQLAKNLFLQREKTISRKVQEAVLTWWLENELTKEEILELYLNVIEYGPSIYGLRNAARQFFSREPADLSPAEAAFLACVLPSPKKFALMAEQEQLSTWMQGKMRRLLEHMNKKDRLGEDALVYGIVELESFRFHPPGGAPPPARTLPVARVEQPPAEDEDLMWPPDAWEPVTVDPQSDSPTGENQTPQGESAPADAPNGHTPDEDGIDRESIAAEPR